MKHTDILEATRQILERNTTGDGYQYDVRTAYPDVECTITHKETGKSTWFTVTDMHYPKPLSKQIAINRTKLQNTLDKESITVYN